MRARGPRRLAAPWVHAAHAHGPAGGGARRPACTYLRACVGRARQRQAITPRSSSALGYCAHDGGGPAAIGASASERTKPLSGRLNLPRLPARSSRARALKGSDHLLFVWVARLFVLVRPGAGRRAAELCLQRPCCFTRRARVTAPTPAARAAGL